MNTPTRLDWFLLAALGLIFGASFAAVSLALTGFGPLSIAAGRITLGAIILWVFARLSGRHMPPARSPDGMKVWGAAIGMGLFSNALPFFLLSWAQHHVASGFAGVSMAAGPLITLILAHGLIAGERITLRRLIGILIGFVGVAVLIGPSALEAKGGELENLARITCVVAAGCYSIGSIIARLCPDVDRRAFSAAVLIAGSVMILPLALWSEGLPQAVPPTRAIAALVFLGLIPTALAQIILVVIIRNAGPTFLSLVNYQVPIWSVVLGAVFLNEALPASLIWAMALILLGVAISQFGALTRLFGRRSSKADPA